MNCILLGFICAAVTSPDYSKVVYAPVTAYVCTLTEECIMSSGKKGYIGAIACPRSMPLKTRVRVDGEVLTCEDRTNLRYNGRFDRFMGYMDDDREALEHGIKVMRVEII